MNRCYILDVSRNLQIAIRVGCSSGSIDNVLGKMRAGFLFPFGKYVCRGPHVGGTKSMLARVVLPPLDPLEKNYFRAALDVGRISHLGGTMLGSARCDEWKRELKKARGRCLI